jgi:ATPase subunit of ABC transporter with duplicated ATPase domains
MQLLLKRGDARGAALLVENVSVYRGPVQILSDIHWRVEPTAKWGVVGANGCGKSTLLKALVGEAPCEEGGIITISSTVNEGYLKQTAVAAGSNNTVYEEAASAMTAIQDARLALERAQQSVQENPSSRNLQKLDSSTARYEAVGGYTQEQKVASVLTGLGFHSPMDQRCDELSGGWQMRVALARLLLSQPSLLILDEPSNHLDANARNWLANYLKTYDGGAMILVTHDVALLQSVSHIAEIVGGTLQTYKSCTHSQYEEEKQARAEAAATEHQRNQEKAAKLQGFVNRFGASATRASAAQSRVKQLERMRQQGLLDAPSTTLQTRFKPSLKLPDPPRAIGETLLSLKEAQVGWTGPLVSNIDLKIKRGMKLLIRGPNGAGKSTILAALCGKRNLLHGTRTENEQLRYVLCLWEYATCTWMRAHHTVFCCFVVSEYLHRTWHRNSTVMLGPSI